MRNCHETKLSLLKCSHLILGHWNCFGTYCGMLFMVLIIYSLNKCLKNQDAFRVMHCSQDSSITINCIVQVLSSGCNANTSGLEFCPIYEFIQLRVPHALDFKVKAFTQRVCFTLLHSLANTWSTVHNNRDSWGVSFSSAHLILCSRISVIVVIFSYDVAFLRYLLLSVVNNFSHFLAIVAGNVG